MQENLNLTQNIENLFSNIENFTQKEGIFGKPVTQEGKTFIPVVSVSVGFGGGNTANKSQQGGTWQNTDKGTGAANVSGGALGLGAKVTVDAIVVIDNGKVSMMTVNTAGNASSIIEKIPEMVKGMGGQQKNS